MLNTVVHIAGGYSIVVLWILSIRGRVKPIKEKSRMLQALAAAHGHQPMTELSKANQYFLQETGCARTAHRYMYTSDHLCHSGLCLSSLARSLIVDRCKVPVVAKPLTKGIDCCGTALIVPRLNSLLTALPRHRGWHIPTATC